MLLLVQKDQTNSLSTHSELNLNLSCSHFLSHPPKMLLPALFLFLATTGTGEGATQQKPPPLLLVSFDGFRADYLLRFNMPNLELLYSQGVLVEELTNAFITKTFPNHYTLVRSPPMLTASIQTTQAKSTELASNFFFSLCR